MHPEYLGARFFNHFPFFLDSRGIDPVFSVQDLPRTLLFRRKHALDTGHSPGQPVGSGKGAAVKGRRPITKVPGKRLFHDTAFARFKDFQNDLFVGGRGGTDVYHVAGRYEFFHGVIGGDIPLLRE